jgi:hypothetical protein
MAVKTEYFMTRKDGVVLNMSYSDEHRELIRDGKSYGAVAIDPAELNRQYTEGDIIPTDTTDMTEIEEKAKAYDVLMGVSE